MNGRSLLRSPYVWGFLIGIVTLTAIRPLLRHIPEPPPVLSTLPEFTLADMEGRPYGSRDLAGQVYIANFFFTRCGSICPKLMQAVGRLQAGFAERGIEGIRLVSISVDPENDTPAVLKEYAGSHGIDPKRWTLLTGDKDAVRALVVSGFKTPMDPVPEGGPTPVEVAHTGKLVLVDAHGRIRGYYDSDDLGLDEVFNRAQHVLRQERERPG